jgi:ubiquinone/menaquinone biosynthesis C-methylase UbiE
LAEIYRPLEYLAFGRDLERARFVHLDRLRDCRSILVLGEGDGRCLEKLIAIAPHARIDCLDLSTKMLARAARRIAGRAAVERVTFRQADLLTADMPPANYDSVITFFFLDCFTAAQCEAVMARIGASLRPGALWLWADFAVPARGWARWRARIWIAALYAYFRWQTGLAARELPPVTRYFSETGLVGRAECTWQWGLVRSEVWLFPPNDRRMLSP